jgi:hypothetical protein
MAKGRKKLICKYCNLTLKRKNDLKNCILCRKAFCAYHQKPESHKCSAVDWKTLQPKKDLKLGDIRLIDILKAGAVLLVLILVVKMTLAVFSRFWNFLKNLWRVARVQIAVIIAVPILLSLTAMHFPESAALLEDGLDSIVDATGLDKLEVPEIFGTNQPAYMSSSQPTKSSPLQGLKGCTIAMTYTSLMETYDGQKCMSLCNDRGYSSYSVIKDGNSFDCYCCDNN